MGGGLSFEEIMEHIDSFSVQLDKDLGKLNKQGLSEYLYKLNTLKKINSSNQNATHKGKALEDIVSFLIEKLGLFNVYKNIRTSSNEIDQLIELNTKGKLLSRFMLSLKDGFICECKNYNKKIPVTWVGKVYSLLCVTNHKIAVVFSYRGLSGKGWNDAVGLTKKLYMMKERDEEKIVIIDFNINDFERIANNESFFKIIEEKVLSLKVDTDISEYLNKHHPAEKLL